MTRKQLQVLISAGIFSTALLSGAAYADDKTTPTPTTPSTTGAPTSTTADPASANSATADPAPKSDSTTQQAPKTTTSSKSGTDHGCGGAGGCSGSSK